MTIKAVTYATHNVLFRCNPHSTEKPTASNIYLEYLCGEM